MYKGNKILSGIFGIALIIIDNRRTKYFAGLVM